MLVSLQNRDSSEDEGNGVDVLVASNGLHIFISEKCDEFMTDPELCHAKFPRAVNETENEHKKRFFAVEQCLREMTLNNDDFELTSDCKIMLPFQVDPKDGSMAFSSANGGRILQINLHEKKDVVRHMERSIDLTGGDDEPVKKKSAKRAPKPNPKCADYSVRSTRDPLKWLTSQTSTIACFELIFVSNSYPKLVSVYSGWWYLCDTMIC